MKTKSKGVASRPKPAGTGRRASPERGESISSRELMGLCDVTPRQLQWWDEHGLISPRIDDHRRLYTHEEVLKVSIAAELRRKRIRLGAIRRILSRIPADIPEYLLIADGKVHGERDPSAVIEKAKKVEGGVMLLEIESKDGIRIAYRAKGRAA